MQTFSLIDSDDDASPRPAASLSVLGRSSSLDSRVALAPHRSVNAQIPGLTATSLPEAALALAARKRGRMDGLSGGTVPQLDEALLLRERDNNEFEITKNQQAAVIDKLQKQVSFLLKEEELQKSRVHEKERQFLTEKQLLTDKCDKLERETRELRMEVGDLKQQAQATAASLNRAEALAASKGRMLEEARRSRESELALMQSELTESQLQASELPLLKREIQRLKEELAASSESAASHAELRNLSNQLVKLQAQVHSLEREKRLLTDDLLSARSRLKAVDTLEAQVSTYQHRLSSNESQLKAAGTLEAQLQELQLEKQRWLDMFRDIMSTEISVSEHAPPSCDPVTVLSYVRDLQSKVVLMSKDKSALSLKAATLQRALDVAEKRVNDLQSEQLITEEKRIAAEEQVFRCERKLALAQKERESLKSLLDTYSAEERIGTNQATRSGSDSLNTAKEKRIHDLEVELSEVTSRFTALESESANRISELTANLEKTRKEFADAKAETAKLHSALERVEIENAKLTSQIGKGAYDPTKTKIMHFAMNPAAMVEKEREEKRAKRIQELEEQVRLLTMQRGGVKDDISGASMAVVTSSEGEDHKLQLQRMKEVFRKKFSTFRDGVYMLTGYKVEMADTNGVTVFTLKSMYAEKEGDSLMFSLADGCLNLIETEFCKNIDAGVFGMLAANKSIPVFLANVTSDLFGRSTVM